MPSNLSCIGFDFADDAAFRGAVERLAASAAERLVTPVGEYAVWRSRTGAEIWFHLALPADGGTEREIVGLTPFFEGRSEVAVKVTTRLTRPDDNPFEGALSAWVAPDDSGEGSYPLVLDLVDAAAIADRALPQLATARIAAFAVSLRAFPSEAAFFADESRGEPKLASRAFIPIGLFAEAVVDREPTVPSSQALLTGHVIEHARLVNEDTGQAYDWLLVDSFAATYDVVADPTVVTGSITVGGVVEVGGSLFGRLLD